MAYAADYTLSQSATFQQQVQMSVFRAAVNISSEAYTSKPVYNKRHALATQVLTQFVMAAIEAGQLVTGATDAQVDAAVSSCWNGVAGVSASDSL
jgi:hypothetical protein